MRYAPEVSRWFGRLDRYILQEIAGPLALGFLVYTFILLLQFLFSSAEMIIRRGLPVSTVAELLLYSLPNIVVLTIPMSLLLGVLVGIGRLASDSELIALRSNGVSIYRMLRPVMALGALLTVITAVLMVHFLPRGNHAVSRLYLDILARTVGQQVEPRVDEVRWRLDPHPRPQHQSGDRDGGCEVLEGSVLEVRHGRVWLRAEVLHDDFLDRVVLTRDPPDGEDRLRPLLQGLADPDQDAGGEWDRRTAGVL